MVFLECVPWVSLLVQKRLRRQRVGILIGDRKGCRILPPIYYDPVGSKCTRTGGWLEGWLEKFFLRVEE